MKYLLIEIEEYNGEQWYIHNYTEVCEDGTDPERVADAAASTWYADASKKVEKNGHIYYEFFGSTIIIGVFRVQEIPKEHYYILQQYAI